MLNVSPFFPKIWQFCIIAKFSSRGCFLKESKEATAESERTGDREQLSRTHSKDRIKSGQSHLQRRIHCYHPNSAALAPHLVLTLFNNRNLPEHSQPFWVANVNSLPCCTLIFSPILGKLRLNPVPRTTLKIRIYVSLKCKMFGQKPLASGRWTGEEAGLDPCVAGIYTSKRGF